MQYGGEDDADAVEESKGGSPSRNVNNSSSSSSSNDAAAAAAAELAQVVRGLKEEIAELLGTGMYSDDGSDAVIVELQRSLHSAEARFAQMRFH